MQTKAFSRLAARITGPASAQKPQTFNRVASALALIVLFSLIAGVSASAQTEKVLHSFNSTNALGRNPDSPVIFDAAGNLYGATGIGGPYDGGSVFELMPTAGGGWTLKILHIFGNTGDGGTPYGSLVLDTAGNLYGVTAFGGANASGTVFELSPQIDGSWSETTLYSFGARSTDGADPTGGLVFDLSGNLYGITLGGGTNNDGTVYKLSPSESGSWTETILHSFGNGTDGMFPYLVTLVLDASGNLYGTTQYGGTYKNGTVFEVSPSADGGWTESVLYSFNPNSTDGLTPPSGLIADSSGNLYGTAPMGGTFNHGAVFELSPVAGGAWTETSIYNFDDRGIEGQGPVASLVFDSAGNLYGTTSNGGAYGSGTAFALAPKVGGGWSEIRLHSFGTGGVDGTYPSVPLVFSPRGILYGTTNNGGSSDYGVIFALKR